MNKKNLQLQALFTIRLKSRNENNIQTREKKRNKRKWPLEIDDVVVEEGIKGG